MPRLTMLRGPEQGRVYEFTKDMVTIGRGIKNDIVIHDNEVSRQHCRLVRVQDDYEIYDLQSSNGTFVNGQRVEEPGRLVDRKCLIELGDSITFEYNPLDSAEDEESIVRHPQMEAYLVVRHQAQQEPALYPLDTGVTTIGRGLDNDIVLQIPQLSRQHIKLTATPRGYTIEDLHSLNGTLLNDELLEDEPLLLRPDDVIRVGISLEIIYTDAPHKYVSDIPLASRLPAGSEDPTHSARQLQTSPLDTQELKSASSRELNHGLDRGDLLEHVFMTYAQEDWQYVVAPLFSYMQARGIPIWIDQYLMHGSPDWEHAVEQAMIECAMLVVVVSPQSMDRPYIRRALRHFVNRSKPVLLMHYRPVERLPIMAENLPAIWYNTVRPEDAFEQLTGHVRRLMP